VNVRSAIRLARAAVSEGRARRSSRQVGIVLVYHRVAEAGGSPAFELSPAVGRAAFREELRYLRRRYHVVAPSQLAGAITGRRPGERLPVAITFDDDTRSHVDDAAPNLDELGIVGGFYVGGSSLHGDARPWWETLQLAVDHDRVPPGLPPRETEAALRREPRAIRRLGAFIEGLEPSARKAVADELAAATSDLPQDPGLDEPALELLAARHEVGFHTRTHDRLAPLGDTELAVALTDGKAAVEAAIGRLVDAIAYPHGSVDARVAAAAGSAGYTLGFAGLNRAARATDQRLLVPRLDPWHDSLGTFAATVAAAALTRRPPP
jgi:peptidoglycan/xylan/chitin deacetylase (PgdA/CDA1 family)